MSRLTRITAAASIITVATIAYATLRSPESNATARQDTRRPERSASEASLDDLPRLRQEVSDSRAELATANGRPPRPAPTEQPASTDEEPPEPLTIEERAEREQVRARAQESLFRDELARQPSDPARSHDMSVALQASLRNLPDVSIESTDCGSDLCVAELRHAHEQSGVQIWEEISANPAFSGQVMVNSHDEGGTTRTFIYAMRPGAEPMEWVE